MKKNAIFCKERDYMAGFKVRIEILWHCQNTKTTGEKTHGTPFFGLRTLHMRYLRKFEIFVFE